MTVENDRESRYGGTDSSVGSCRAWTRDIRKRQRVERTK